MVGILNEDRSVSDLNRIRNIIHNSVTMPYNNNRKYQKCLTKIDTDVTQTCGVTAV